MGAAAKIPTRQVGGSVLNPTPRSGAKDPKITFHENTGGNTSYGNDLPNLVYL